MTISETLVYHLTNMPIAGSLGYLLMVEYLRQAMDKRAKPVAIPKPVLVLYNVVQVLINFYVAYDIAVATGGRVWGLGLADTPAVRYGVWLHYLCKYLDMLDTLIIVLRKKSEQLSFLHLWHHSTIVVVWGWVVNTWPTQNSSSAYAYGAWINSCIHVIMYAQNRAAAALHCPAALVACVRPLLEARPGRASWLDRTTPPPSLSRALSPTLSHVALAGTLTMA